MVRVIQETIPSETYISDIQSEVQEAATELSSASDVKSAPQTVQELIPGSSSSSDKRKVAGI